MKPETSNIAADTVVRSPGQNAPQPMASLPRTTLIRRTTRWGEWLIERGIFLFSLSAIVMIFLIFAFVGREALPVILGRTSNARDQRPISAEQNPSLSVDEL